MVHEYIEDLTVLSSALRSGHAFVPSLVSAARRCVSEAERLIEKSQQSQRGDAALASRTLFGNSF